MSDTFLGECKDCGVEMDLVENRCCECMEKFCASYLARKSIILGAGYVPWMTASEMGKRSVESRKNKLGKDFAVKMKEIAKLPRKYRKAA